MNVRKRKVAPPGDTKPLKAWGLPDAGKAVDEVPPTTTFSPTELPVGHTGIGETREGDTTPSRNFHVLADEQRKMYQAIISQLDPAELKELEQALSRSPLAARFSVASLMSGTGAVFEAEADQPEEVGEIFQKAREIAGLSIRRAAKEAEKNTDSQLRQLERGSANSQLSTLNEYAKVYDFKVKISLSRK